MAIKTTSGGAARRALLPIGKYLTVVETVEKTLSKSGKERLAFTFRITSGDNTGKKIYEDFYLTEGALWKLMDLCEALGLAEGVEIEDDDPAKLMNMFSGKSVWLMVSEDNWKDAKGAERDGRRVSRFDSTDPAVRAKQDEKRRVAALTNSAGAAATSGSGSDAGEAAPI